MRGGFGPRNHGGWCASSTMRRSSPCGTSESIFPGVATRLIRGTEWPLECDGPPNDDSDGPTSIDGGLRRTRPSLRGAYRNRTGVNGLAGLTHFAICREICRHAPAAPQRQRGASATQAEGRSDRRSEDGRDPPRAAPAVGALVPLDEARGRARFAAERERPGARPGLSAVRCFWVLPTGGGYWSRQRCSHCRRLVQHPN